MDTEQSLAKLKVPELKARCKALKIPNFSKLSKPDLIAKILASAADTATDAHTTSRDNATVGTTTETSYSTGTPAPAKDPGAKEKKKESVKRKAATAPERDGTPADDLPVGPAKKLKPKSVKGLGKADKATTQGDSRASLPAGITSSVTPATPMIPVEPAARPTKDAQTSAAASPPNRSVAPVLSAARPPVPKTAKDIHAKPTTVVKAKFQPLAKVAPKVSSTPTPTAAQPERAFSLATPADRVTFVQGHFLNGMFKQLNRYRTKPITVPPFPSYLSYPKSSPTAHLAFQGLHPDLYVKAGADAFEVALRFWIARLHSSMQLGSSEAWSLQAGGMGLLGPDMSTWPPIVGCTRVAGDVWMVTTKEDRVDIRYLVIGEIGEVIGHSREVNANDDGSRTVLACRVRDDWKRYIADDKRKTLSSAVKSKDSHSFPGGISRVWRAAQQSDYKIKIAGRAVLASCALNSFSGEKLTSIAMDAAWLGRPTAGGYNANASDGLDLYLPEPAQVVSVHQPADLHPALAIVHRASGYSEYILAQTGQVVGSEDEGVVRLWQSLLRCDEKGVKAGSSQEEFWQGWEDRLKKAE